MKTQNKSQSKSKVPKEGLFPEIIRNDYQGSRKLLGEKEERKCLLIKEDLTRKVF